MVYNNIIKIKQMEISKINSIFRQKYSTEFTQEVTGMSLQLQFIKEN